MGEYKKIDFKFNYTPATASAKAAVQETEKDTKPIKPGKRKGREGLAALAEEL